jgi:hypothetical protein
MATLERRLDDLERKLGATGDPLICYVNDWQTPARLSPDSPEARAHVAGGGRLLTIEYVNDWRPPAAQVDNLW